MWTILFEFSVAAAIAFSLASILVEHCRMPEDDCRSDASALLLVRRMRLLDLDPAVVAQAEPLSFWELEAGCKACNSKERCACDVAANSHNWRNYCPNGLMLNLLRMFKTPVDALAQH